MQFRVVDLAVKPKCEAKGRAYLSRRRDVPTPATWLGVRVAVGIRIGVGVGLGLGLGGPPRRSTRRRPRSAGGSSSPPPRARCRPARGRTTRAYVRPTGQHAASRVDDDGDHEEARAHRRDSDDGTGYPGGCPRPPMCHQSNGVQRHVVLLLSNIFVQLFLRPCWVPTSPASCWVPCTSFGGGGHFQRTTQVTRTAAKSTCVHSEKKATS